MDPIWRKSTRSTGEGNCVELAHPTPLVIKIRDSKNPTGPTLTLPTPTWSHFPHLN